MAYCSECAKLEDAAEAATLEYDELLSQRNRAAGASPAPGASPASGASQTAASGDALVSAREKRDRLRKELTEHKAVHL
ncbi:MAG: hypothetical protein ACR2NN_16465 [Bryobacteraceae bacterium]